MTFQVEVLPAAEAEIEAAYLWLFERSPQHASQWQAGLLEAIASLSTMPDRCGYAPECK
jgi:plasmid stabilization system protein ParE